MRTFFLLAALLLASGCGNQQKIDELTETVATLESQMENYRAENTRLKKDLREIQKSYGQLTDLAARLKGVKARLITNFGAIELEFFPEKAPLHCFTFITRAEAGFYDNTKFHRIVPGFMIQGGDPNSRDDDPYNDGTGGPLVMIPHEFNDTPHTPGILSTARVGNTAMGAGSQFFIMHGNAPHLDGQYTAFGQVTAGMDVVNEIAALETYGNKDRRRAEQPVKPVIIRRVEVFRHGG